MSSSRISPIRDRLRCRCSRMVRVDGTVLAWTLLIAVAAAVLFGSAPGLRMSAGNLQEVLKDSGHGPSEGRKHDRLRSTLVITEIALACVLLVGAGLLLRSFLRVLDVDLGFEPSHAAAISVDYDDGGNAGQARGDMAGCREPSFDDSGRRGSRHIRQPAHEPEPELGDRGKRRAEAQETAISFPSSSTSFRPAI